MGSTVLSGPRTFPDGVGVPGCDRILAQSRLATYCIVMSQVRIVARVEGQLVDLQVPDERLRTFDDACRLAVELGVEFNLDTFVLYGEPDVHAGAPLHRAVKKHCAA